MDSQIGYWCWKFDTLELFLLLIFHFKGGGVGGGVIIVRRLVITFWGVETTPNPEWYKGDSIQPICLWLNKGKQESREIVKLHL